MSEELLDRRQIVRPTVLDRLAALRPSSVGNTGGIAERREEKDWRESLIRDLRWLLDCSCLSQTVDLSSHPQVQSSVLNYGWPKPVGRVLNRVEEVREVERNLIEAIRKFEKRFLTSALDVQIVSDRSGPHNSVLHVRIHAEFPAGIRSLRLEVSIDLDSGEVVLEEQNASRFEKAGHGT